MKKITLLFTGVLLMFGCQNSSEITKESWTKEPVSSWPEFALTNEICFSDTTYRDIANAFLVNTGADTIGISCKHMFFLFEEQLGLSSIDLGDGFDSWHMYPKNRKEKRVTTKKLINKNPKEAIGQYNTMKVRDWILFELKNQNNQLYPLKIRYSAVQKNEIVYAVGWGWDQKDIRKPSIRKLKCYKNLEDYFYAQPIKEEIHPRGTSGSPVIDSNGYLVGIVSGQEGKMAVIGGVKYLKQMFNQYGIEYNESSH